jgi:hypothetical protein
MNEVYKNVNTEKTNGEPVLCYIEGCWAYFTTQELSEQWGDDWNDASYEHNAEEPYEYAPLCAEEGQIPWTITKVAFDGDFVAPCQERFPSQLSVEQINAGCVPWLRLNAWRSNKPVIIPAGTTLDRFCELIRESGGHVYYDVCHCFHTGI